MYGENMVIRDNSDYCQMSGGPGQACSRAAEDDGSEGRAAGMSCPRRPRRLPYRVHRSSSQLAGFAPENVLVDKPTDQFSRWTTSNNSYPQNLILKLSKPAIVKSIVFGKYCKTHICNLKKFSVHGGMQDENLNELLTAGLENNSNKEEFQLRHTTKDGQMFPVQYISIIPHVSWGPSLNYSIWYLELHGIDDPSLIKNVLFKYNLYAEKEAIRLCLKHFRQQKYLTAYDELQKQTGITLEAPELTRLYELLVEEGDFEGAEDIIHKSADDGLFNWYVSQQPYMANWNNVSPCSPDLVARLSASTDSTPFSSPSPPLTAVSPDSEFSSILKTYDSTERMADCDRTRPGQRGGHQMCLDSTTNSIYLFGGWDGEIDLSDLWSYSASDDKWTLIYKYSEQSGGPKPRSCHKMVLDSSLRQLYVMGRYIDTKNRSTDNLKSDFYMFDITKWQWNLLSEDTSLSGGPSLIFDHQMCIDVERHIIYVFGGKLLSPAKEGEESSQYSGLYAYYILENRWKLLLPDIADTYKAYKDISVTNVSSILSRAGHSMLFHPINRTLYIFGGQRNKEYQSELLAVNVGTNEDNLEKFPIVNAVCKAASPKRAPPAGFTQRATIDPELNEIYVLSGLSKEKDKRVSNSLWVYSIINSQWSCIYKNDSLGDKYWSKMHITEPCPRFAHQLVYDSVYKVHYLFGGNPGRSAQPSLRLDDFWILKLSRINSASALWRARLHLRKLRFQELAESGNTHEALSYLQTNLHEATDHSDPEQVRDFQLMASMLFSDKIQNTIFHPPLDSSQDKSNSSMSDSESQENMLATSSDNQVHSAMFAAVLGMETSSSESPEIGNNPTTPNEFPNMSIGCDDSFCYEKDVEEDKWNRWEIHYRRCQLFQQLSSYFPQNMVQPRKNLTDYFIL